MRFAEFTLQIDVFTLIQCHLKAFSYFGAILKKFSMTI
jgi:transposase